jgi:hypothetical protein
VRRLLQLPASRVVTGQFVRHPTGDVIKVLASYADVGAASASATTWCVEGYAEGQPTARIRCTPDALVEVVPG